jgi:hypothetical protein
MSKGFLYVADRGGENCNVELYDVAADKWTAVAAELEARYQRGAVTV